MEQKPIGFRVPAAIPILNYLVSWLFIDNKGTRILYWLCSDPPSKNKNSSCNFFTLAHFTFWTILFWSFCLVALDLVRNKNSMRTFFCYSLLIFLLFMDSDGGKGQIRPEGAWAALLLARIVFWICNRSQAKDTFLCVHLWLDMINFK